MKLWERRIFTVLDVPFQFPCLALLILFKMGLMQTVKPDKNYSKHLSENFRCLQNLKKIQPQKSIAGVANS